MTASPKVILPEGFDEVRAFETPLRGYLSEVFVELEDGRKFPLFFIDPVRLSQDLEANIGLGEPYVAEPGMVVLPEVTVEAIHAAVTRLYKDGYFAKFPAGKTAETLAVSS